MDHIYNHIQGWFDYEDLYTIIVDKLPDTGFRFAELGVWKGRSLSYFTVESINKNKKGTIYAIDHWLGSIEHLCPDSNTILESNLEDSPEGLYEKFLNNINPIKELITIIRKPSLDAARIIEDKSLDAIFIDASHEYKDVLLDLKAWVPKIKEGGIIAGHDWDWPGVQRAVKEFAAQNNRVANRVPNTSWILTQ